MGHNYSHTQNTASVKQYDFVCDVEVIVNLLILKVCDELFNSF